jgi:hypothetical protein
MEQSVPKRRHIKFRRRGIPRRKHATYRIRQEFEIKNISNLFAGNFGGRLEFRVMNALEHDVAVNY